MRIAALRALRYNPREISFISRVVAPPYDVIDGELAGELRERDPHNVIRLILGTAGNQPRPDAEYRRAARLLERWREQQVLLQDDEPALFVCRETFEVNGSTYTRHGLLCGYLLEDVECGAAMPHERTTEGPRADRLRLIEACAASLSPVFGVYPDQEGHGVAALQEQCTGWPVYEFQQEGVAYEVWRVTDPASCARLAAVLRDRELLIADGHHRYETALAYREAHRDPDAPPGKAPEDWLLLYAVSAADDGLRILPTHRLAKAEGDFDQDCFLESLQRLFDVTEAQVSRPESLPAVAAELEDRTMACYTRTERLHVMLPKYADPLAEELPEHSKAWRTLPVTLLHYGVLGPFFGLPAEARSGNDRLVFTPDAADMYWAVESGRFDAAFLLPPAESSVVEQIARSGERMPPKSTYFFPKVLSGLLIYPFQDDAAQPLGDICSPE